MNEKILIDAGPSEEGFSRIESFLRCERLYRIDHVDHSPRVDRVPLVRGSIGHVGLAHYYQRIKEEQSGRDPGAYYTPDEAMELCAVKFGPMGLGLLELVKSVVAAYVAHYGREGFKILEVETPVRALVFGNHGITQRLDLAIEDLNGWVWLYDHKFVSAVSQKTFDRYTLSGQFLLMQNFGRALYGERFAGVRVNLAGCTPPFYFKRGSLEPAPAAMRSFPLMVANVRERIAALKAKGDPEAYLPAYNEQICQGPYGKCEAFNVCQWGEET